MHSDDVKIGEHFWGTIGDNETQIMVFIKTESGFFVCGEWECPIRGTKINVIETIPIPKGYEDKELYYNY